MLAGVVITLAQIWEQERRDMADVAERLVRLEADLVALDGDTEAEYERVCQHTARLLHGPIQGRLAAIAMLLQLSSREDGGVSPATLNTCRSLADACVEDLDLLVQVDRAPPPLEEAMRILRGRWLGLLALRWYFQPEARALIDSDMVLRTKFEDFVADCATNACRHGAARRMTVSARILDSGDIEVAAEDDGGGPALPIDVGSGLGALGRQGMEWTIDRTPEGGCVVRYRLTATSVLRRQAEAVSLQA